MANPYLMESEAEGDRLLTKGDVGSTEEQLKVTGLLDCTKSARVCDVGCGVGFVSEIMARLVKKTDPNATIVLVDGSADRLQEAASRVKAAGILSVDAQNCQAESISVADESCDYVFSRFLFEYLEKPEIAFAELYRITKPGGRIVVGDLDYNSLSHYPLAPKLEAQLHELVRKLSETKLFDPYAGRKLYGYFHNLKCDDVKVHFYAHHLFYGRLPDRDLTNWRMKFDQINQLVKKGVIGLTFELPAFAEEFFAFLQSPNRFTYTPLILVEGKKPL